MCSYLPAEASRGRLGEHALSSQHRVMINELPRRGGDPAVGWALPQRGANYVPLQFLVFSIELSARTAGEGDWELLRPPSVPL